MNFSNKHVAKIFFVADPVEEFSQIIFNCNFETLNLDLDLKLPEFNLRRIIWGVEVQKKVYNFSDTTNQTFVYKWYTSEAFDGKKNQKYILLQLVHQVLDTGFCPVIFMLPLTVFICSDIFLLHIFNIFGSYNYILFVIIIV